jgi:ribosomal-protein-alanine N-acetyltransferase
MFETQRLLLRSFVDNDIDAILAMRSDAEFMRFIKPTENRRQTITWIDMISRPWKTENFGYWAVVLKETEETIGWSGTWNLYETSEPEIGFAIAPKYKNRGLATEAASVALKYSFENRRAEQVAALSMPENLASQRVMEKLGMHFVEQKYFGSYGLKLNRFVVTKEEYARNKTLNHALLYA